MTRVLIIGGGMAGCCAAHVLSENDWKVTLVETAPFLGGGCKTFLHGGHPYTYGPRHFLTRDERLFEFLNRYVPMRRIPDHEFLTYIERDPGFYHFPIHRDDVDLMPDAQQITQELAGLDGVEGASNLEEYWMRSVGPTLYSKFIDGYSRKMWRIPSNTEIDDFGFSPKGVALKTGTEKAAWTEAISAFPVKINGYDDYFDLATRQADVHLRTKVEAYDIERLRVKIDGEWHAYDLIISTTSPELLMNGAFGPLRWMGRDFLKIVLPVEEAFPPHVYFLYYANAEPFTRIVEYKKFYQYKAPTTLLGLEIPSSSNQLYPYPVKKDQAIAQQYLDALPKNVFSIGRAGSYRYIDVDDIIAQCLDLGTKLGVDLSRL
ncbi:MAG: FAD-dependent oxidoreductase [Candidatus Omnitrophota bacterium]|nr:FAD-dependent oxidoreductase [Candidatus Omnitrophota bacterium]